MVMLTSNAPVQEQCSETGKGNIDAHKVFVEMTMSRFLERYGTVREYYDSFNSRWSSMLTKVEEWYLADLFTCGLPLEIARNVRICKPKKLYDAYCLAINAEALFAIKIPKQEGSVKEYYELFNSFVDRMGVADVFTVSLFIEGLHPEIGKIGNLFKPKTLHDAYLLANMQEKTNELLKEGLIKNSELEMNESRRVDVNGVVNCEEVGKVHETEIESSGMNMDKTFVDCSIPQEKLNADINVEFESEQEADNTCFVSPDESVQGSEEIELFGYCSSDMGKSCEVDQKVRWKSRVPCILFVDEIDRQREVGLIWENDEREQTLHQLLAEMDGFVGNNTEVSVLTDTNRFDDIIESELLEPRCLDRYLCDDRTDIVSAYGSDIANQSSWTNVSIRKEDVIGKESSFGQLKFYICKWSKKRKKYVTVDYGKWPTRKKMGDTQCNVKFRKGEFDMWKWPRRKKKLTHKLAHLSLLLNDKWCSLVGVSVLIASRTDNNPWLLPLLENYAYNSQVHGSDLYSCY